MFLGSWRVGGYPLGTQKSNMASSSPKSQLFAALNFLDSPLRMVLARVLRRGENFSQSKDAPGDDVNLIDIVLALRAIPVTSTQPSRTPPPRPVADKPPAELS